MDRVSLKQMEKVNPTFHRDPKEFEKATFEGRFFFLGGGNSNILGMFIPKIGEDSHFDTYFFERG